MLISNAKAAKR